MKFSISNMISDLNKISVNFCSNMQENCVLHAVWSSSIGNRHFNSSAEPIECRASPTFQEFQCNDDDKRTTTTTGFSAKLTSEQTKKMSRNNPVDTVIAFDAHNTSDSSATFSACADNFMARDIGFKNTYGSIAPGNWTQNTAVRVYGDKSAFYNCRFEGIQDTLWDVLGRHYFKSCHIQGAVDFIWGSGQSVYEDCDIKVLFGGFITAQGRQRPNDTSGFVFLRGKVRGVGRSYLGRAYDTYSRVIFRQTYLGSVVEPLGWNAWHAIHQEQHVTYIESDCSGPGADLTHRVPWMKKRTSAKELSQYTVSAFIDQDGWISKQPHVPSLSG